MSAKAVTRAAVGARGRPATTRASHATRSRQRCGRSGEMLWPCRITLPEVADAQGGLRHTAPEFAGFSAPQRCQVPSTAVTTDVVTMDKIVALCKRRGLIFPASEIYGGIANTYDY